MRRRTKLIIGVVATLALLICGATYLLLIEWPSTTGGQPMVQQGCCGTELLTSGEPTRTISLGEYSYEVRFYNASASEDALVGASIQYSGPPQPGYRLTVSLSHPIETGYFMLDGPHLEPHLESLSLTFNFSSIETLSFPLWVLPPTRGGQFPSNISSSFSLESRIVDVERGVWLLNFSRLRNLEVPAMSPIRWSWVSFGFLMAQEHVHAFTLEVSFTLRLPSGGKVMYQKGTATLDFRRPAVAASPSSSVTSEVVAPPLLTFRPRPDSVRPSSYVLAHK